MFKEKQGEGKRASLADDRWRTRDEDDDDDAGV